MRTYLVGLAEFGIVRHAVRSPEVMRAACGVQVARLTGDVFHTDSVDACRRCIKQMTAPTDAPVGLNDDELVFFNDPRLNEFRCSACTHLHLLHVYVGGLDRCVVCECDYR